MEPIVMEPDEILEGEDILEKLINLIKRTPESVNSSEEGEEFESAEHENIGNKVKLRFPDPNCGRREQDGDQSLRFPNGVQLSFGQIIALAGDFYGVPEHPVVDPSEKDDEKSTGRRQRFIAAYNTLADAKYDDIEKELHQILIIMTKERKQIEAALQSQEGKVTVSDKQGNVRMVPKDVYDKLGNSLVEEWDTVLGGKWFFGVPVIFGRMMKLAANNSDHFLPFAKDAYLAGHELALEKARDASKFGQQETKIKLLEEAYSIDAFACHFLTDSFSSGHLRTPRLELAQQVTPSQAGNLLSKYMHDEDNKYGIRVTNKRGDKWIAYGDGMLLNGESEANYRIAVDAVQASVNHVYNAFLHPKEPYDSSVVADYIPFVDPNEENNFPMFQVQNGKLLRRADLNNLRDPTTKKKWTGLQTVLDVRSYTPDGSVLENDDDDEDIDCRSCSQSLHPKLLTENH